MEKKFNITGTCRPTKHYMADVSDKLKSTIKMVDFGEYFAINRPRQYGKTTLLSILARELYQRGDYVVFSISFEGVGNVFFDNEENIAKGFVQVLKTHAPIHAAELIPVLTEIEKEVNNLSSLSNAITKLVSATPKKVVLMIDEVDKSSNNDLFISFLAMLRSKFLMQEDVPTFHSIILAGLYDIKTLKAKLRPDAEQKYNSPWNIAADFKVNMSLETHQIVPMLVEYAQDKGVKMDCQAIAEQLFYYTSGYPFLVSKICKILDEDVEKHDTWTNEDIEKAVRILCKESNANFDTLTKNLENNPELYQYIYDIIIDNDQRSFNIHNPITNMAVLHGFVREQDDKVAIHNRVYREVIANYMTDKMHKAEFSSGNIGAGYHNPNGSLNMEAVLLGFQAFMKKEYSKKEKDFLEKNGRLVFLAFIKPIINGKGFDFKEPQISDEKRLDVVITYLNRKYVAELKLWRGPKAHEKGLKQLADYLDIQSMNEGYLVIFDRSEVKNWQTENIEFEGKKIFVVWV